MEQQVKMAAVDLVEPFNAEVTGFSGGLPG
jgi:hypothetical protein